jgi:threonine synthase
MAHAKAFVCVECGKNFKPKKKLFHCKKCGGSLDIEYDYKLIENMIIKESFIREDSWHWKYWMFYPVLDLSNRITLREGGTPLLKSNKFSKKNLQVYLKFEGSNPTGSFKDRGTTVEISKAVEFGMKKVCCATTGNMGASVSAYCAKAGIDCKIFIPKDAAGSKVKQIQAHGAEMIRTKDYSDAFRKCERYAHKTGSYLTGDYPHRCEGEKSVGFEIADQLNWKVPDYVICPMGNGTLIFAVWDAFNDLKKVNLIDKLPKMVGIQAKGCSPIVDAYNKKRKIKPIKNPKTIASAIECGDPVDGEKALTALKKSKGFVKKVSDKDIIHTLKILARKEGLFVEPSGAVSLIGMFKLKRLKGNVVCILTGHGLKHPL